MGSIEGWLGVRRLLSAVANPHTPVPTSLTRASPALGYSSFGRE